MEAGPEVDLVFNTMPHRDLGDSESGGEKTLPGHWPLASRTTYFIQKLNNMSLILGLAVHGLLLGLRRLALPTVRAGAVQLLPDLRHVRLLLLGLLPGRRQAHRQRAARLGLRRVCDAGRPGGRAGRGVRGARGPRWQVGW